VLLTHFVACHLFRGHLHKLRASDGSCTNRTQKIAIILEIEAQRSVLRFVLAIRRTMSQIHSYHPQHQSIRSQTHKHTHTHTHTCTGSSHNLGSVTQVNHLSADRWINRVCHNNMHALFNLFGNRLGVQKELVLTGLDLVQHTHQQLDESSANRTIGAFDFIL
jgi:hypothetical protein